MIAIDAYLNASKDNFDAFAEKHPKSAMWLENCKSSFAQSLRAQVRQRGTLSEKQLAAANAGYERDYAYLEKKEEVVVVAKAETDEKVDVSGFVYDSSRSRAGFGVRWSNNNGDQIILGDYRYCEFRPAKGSSIRVDIDSQIPPVGDEARTSWFGLVNAAQNRCRASAEKLLPVVAKALGIAN